MNHTLIRNLYYEHRSTAINQPGGMDGLVVNALCFVIQHFLKQISISLTITVSTSKNLENYWFQDLISKLFASCGPMSVQLMINESKQNVSTLAGRRFNNLIFVDSFEGLRGTNLQENNRIYNSLEYYMIFLQIPDRLMPLQREKILNYCFDNYWLHCNVMVQNGHGEILIYTYFPFQDNGCFQTNPVLINKFEGKRFANDEIFPNKLKHLHRCPLKLTTWNVPPFVAKEPNQTIEELAGMEIIILKALSKELNFTLELDNESQAECPNEALDVLKERRSNISAGFFRRTVYRDLLATASHSFYHLPLISVMNRKQIQLESLDILTYPFDTYTWVMVIVSTWALILINSIKSSKCGGSFNRWHIVEALLGFSTLNVPRHRALRTSFIIWIFASFIIRCMYQSLLFYLYRIHFYKIPPDTIADLHQENFTSVCTRTTAPFLHHIEERSLPMITLNSTNEMDALHYLQAHKDQKLMAMSTEEFILYFVANKMGRNAGLTAASEIVNTQQISFYFPKHSYLIERFNEYILRLQQSRLLERWRKEALTSKHVRKLSVSAACDEQLIINMKHVLGFIKVILILDTIAFVVFTLELLSQWLVWLQKIFLI